MAHTVRTHSSVMQNEQQSSARDTASWRLAPGVSRRLTIGPGPRWLQVADGRLWLTVTGGGGAMGQDHWLAAGEALRLDSGTEVVLEASGGEARFELLVSPQACTAGAVGRHAAGVGRWLRRLVAVARRTGTPASAYLAS